jgi:simple sugar transport system permease protein
MNLGLEGIMLMGALGGFWVNHLGYSPWLAILFAFGVGALMGLVHAFLCVSLRTNQVVSGLALTMFGTGASSLLGRAFIGETIKGIRVYPVPGLSEIPWIGPIFFNHDPLVYIAYFLVGFLCWFLFHTRPGLNLRAVGESPQVVDAAGLSAVKLRYLYTIIGAGIVGIGGAYMSVVYNKLWGDMMTAGRGWIAVALVIFAIWHPLRAAFGAYLFGGVEAMQLRMQAGGAGISAPLLLMLPYLFTIGVLLFISIRKGKGILLGAPAALGEPYYREERE